MGMGRNGNGNGFMGMGGNGNENSPSRTPLLNTHGYATETVQSRAVVRDVTFASHMRMSLSVWGTTSAAVTSHHCI